MKAKIIINEAKEAKQEDKRELSSDIFTAGNVVVSKETGNIVLVSGSGGFSSGYFTGLYMDEFNTSDYFLKDNFVQFHGSIVISTEA